MTPENRPDDPEAFHDNPPARAGVRCPFPGLSAHPAPLDSPDDV